jgi:hypothetical protein
MVIQLDTLARPLVQFALCRDRAQYPLWDTKLDYRESAIPHRLLAYGVAIAQEGGYICAELSPFEPHPLLRKVLRSWKLLRSRRPRQRVFQWWPDRDEASRIERSVHLLSRRVGQEKLRKILADIWDTTLPSVIMYSIDGEWSWKPIETQDETWMARTRNRLATQRTIDPGETCLKLGDRTLNIKETDRNQWLKIRLSDRVRDCFTRPDTKSSLRSNWIHTDRTDRGVSYGDRGDRTGVALQHGI